MGHIPSYSCLFGLSSSPIDSCKCPLQNRAFKVSTQSFDPKLPKMTLFWHKTAQKPSKRAKVDVFGGVQIEMGELKKWIAQSISVPAPGRMGTEPQAGALLSSQRWSTNNRSCHSFGNRSFHRACLSERINCRASNSSASSNDQLGCNPLKRRWRVKTWEGAGRAGGAQSRAPGVCGSRSRCAARDSTAPNSVPTGQWYGVPS